jgi:hypothetical protein
MIATCLLMSGLAFCQNYSVIITSVAPLAGQPCSQIMTFTVHAQDYKIRIIRTVSGGTPMYAFPLNYPPFGVAHPGGNSVYDVYQMAVNPSVTTDYKIEVWDASNPFVALATDVWTVLPSPCNFRTIKTTPGVNPNSRIASPEDPHESTLTELEVKWKLEEIDPTTGESVFTIDNPLNWAASNAPGASNAFNGFNGFEVVTSVDALQAGDMIPDAGIFDPDKIYRVTRSTKYPNDSEWLESTAYIGRGMDEVIEEERSAVTELIGGPDLFTLGQNREAKTVTFTSMTDNGTLEIYDIAGNNVKTINLQKEVFIYEMNATTLGKGMYVVSMQSGSQTTVKKFTIE